MSDVTLASTSTRKRTLASALRSEKDSICKERPSSEENFEQEDIVCHGRTHQRGKGAKRPQLSPSTPRRSDTNTALKFVATDADSHMLPQRKKVRCARLS